MLIKHIPKKKILLLLGDMVIIGLAYFLSPLIRFGSLSFDVIQVSLSGILVLEIYLLSFYLADIYDTNSNFKSFRYLSKFLATVCIATVIDISLRRQTGKLTSMEKGLSIENLRNYGFGD